MKYLIKATEVYATDPSLAGGVLFGTTDCATLGPYLSCLESMEVDPARAWEEAGAAKGDREGVEERLFLMQLEAARGICAGKKAIGLMIHEYSGPMFNQMQTSWADALRNDPRFQLFVVITDLHLAPPAEHLDRAFRGIPWIWAPPGEKLSRLDFLDAVVALDYASERMRRLPPGTRRFLQPHGTDILARYGYMFYGAGLIFDYLLCPTFDAEILDPNLPALMADVFPPQFVDHPARTLTLIPFGNLKLDSFIGRARGAAPRDIIYNFSYWKIESDTARAHSAQTVEALLAAFPDRRLVFRPFPGDVDCHRELIERFSAHPNFHLSTGPSYIEDYREGALLLHHRGSSCEVFAMATLQPAVRFEERTPPPPARETPLGFEVYSLEQLIEVARAILDAPELCRGRLERYRAGKYPNAGRSLETFLDQLHLLLQSGAPDPSWRTVELFATPGLSGLDAARLSVTKALRQGDLIPMLATAAADAYPDEALFQLYAGWCVITHIYPAEFTPDPWLQGCEYLASFFRLAGERWRPMAEEIGAGHFIATEFPARLLGLVSRSTHALDGKELARLQSAVAAIPLDPFAVGSIQSVMLERLAQGDRAAAACQELSWRHAAALSRLGSFTEALDLVRGLPPRSAEEEYLLSLLLFRNGDVAGAFDRALALVQRHPYPEPLALVFEMAPYFSLSDQLAEILIPLLGLLPDRADSLGPAVNLARCWSGSRFLDAALDRLSESRIPEAAAWREYLAGAAGP